MTSSTELVHFGVKGMRWGHRKEHDDSPNPGYTRNMRNYDTANHGEGGAKRINRRLNEGQDLKTARKNEFKRRRTKRRIIGGTLLAARLANDPRIRENIRMAAGVTHALLKLAGDAAAYKIAERAETKRGQATLADTMGLPRNPTNGPTVSKKSKQGVHNITTL